MDSWRMIPFPVAQGWSVPASGRACLCACAGEQRYEHMHTVSPARFTPALHPPRLHSTVAHASPTASHSAPGRCPALPSRSRSPHLSRLVAFSSRLHLRLAAGRAAVHASAPGPLLRPVRAAVVPASSRWRAGDAPNVKPRQKALPCRESARPGDASISGLADTPLRFVSPVPMLGKAIAHEYRSHPQNALRDFGAALRAPSARCLRAGLKPPR